jgi:hypothetical protein
MRDGRQMLGEALDGWVEIGISHGDGHPVPETFANLRAKAKPSLVDSCPEEDGLAPFLV